MKSTGVFIHGLESSGQGTKGRFFRERYPEMIIEDYVGSLAQRMEKLEGLLAGKDQLILVGSSYGGLMAAIYASLHEERVKKLILLAPALHLEDYHPYLTTKLSIPVIIFHGRQDEVVPMEAVRAVAEEHYLNLQFNVLEDNHVLQTNFAKLNWDLFLENRE
jgi:pimeloyl-ACP methyl ester carboxylesterase